MIFLSGPEGGVISIIVPPLHAQRPLTRSVHIALCTRVVWLGSAPRLKLRGLPAYKAQGAPQPPDQTCSPGRGCVL